MEMKMTEALNHIANDADDYQYDFETSHREWMVQQEREWRAAGFTVSWIDTRPKWLSVINWSWPNDVPHEWPLIDPDRPCRRTWRFSLIGGGQIKVIEHWVESKQPPPISGIWNPRIEIVVAAHGDDRLRIYRGEIDDILGEMQAAAVLLRGGHEDIQAVADRAATPWQKDLVPPEEPLGFRVDELQPLEVPTTEFGDTPVVGTGSASADAPTVDPCAVAEQRADVESFSLRKAEDE
jgi:hypothetical protein